jgi:hypothetical protein
MTSLTIMPVILYVVVNSKFFVVYSIYLCTNDDRAKYGLAVVERLLKTFGSGLSVGYDIGCRFGTTIMKSALSLLAKELNYKSLIGTFHGHAHNRLCQLSHLATYVNGLGIEDLEGCEHYFSKSNALASSTRYSTSFHCHQKIMEYMRETDTFDTYANQST